MKLWQRILKFRRRHQDFDDEVSAHLAMAAADRKARGEPPAEAERNARREFGNALLIREVTHDINGWTAVENVIRNLRYAGRQLRRTPVFSGVAVATLALGLGATTAMFTIVDGVLLRPLAFSQPERLYLARTVPPPAAGIGGDFPVNARQFAEWQEHCGGCESLALFQYQDMTLAGSGEPLKLPSLWVTPEFFRTLGVEPAIGRGFPPEAGNGGAVILSHQLWRSRFNSDPAVPGRTVRLNGESYEVVGVMPASLHLPKGDEWGAYSGPDAAPLIFRPLTINVKSARPVGNLNYGALIRLKPGVSAAQAEAELNALLAEFRRQFRMETRIRVVPLDQQVTRGARSSLWMLLASVAAVLLIGCVNVGNLMLARTAGRHREAAIRMALGSTREQLFGLLLGEALVLVVLGGALGVGLAWVGLQLFEAAAPVGIARIDEVHLDWRALLFAAGAMAVSTVMCGLVPAWRLSRTSVQEALKSGGAGATDSRARLELRGVLVGVEVALSTVLLICGALLLLSFWRVMKVEKGFDVARIVTQDVSYLSPRYSHGARRQEVLNTVDRLSAIPGVQVAAAVSRLPLRGDEFVSELEDPAQPPRKVDDSALGNFRFVTPGYWTAMGIPLRMGRYLDASDQDQPRAVISERAARFLWPGQNPLGRHVRGVGDKAPVLEVVGVVGEVRSSSLEKEPPMTVYEHYWRMQPVAMSFVLRTYGEAVSVTRPLHEVLARGDPEMALPPPVAMEQIVDTSVATRRLQMRLAGVFALAALLLASLGIYGMTSFTVARRTPEIGIRMALGAAAHQVGALVLMQAMRPVLVGLGVGLGCALFAMRWIVPLLFDVEARDPMILAGVSLVLIAVAGGAALIPAMRAMRAEPVSSLRFE